MREIKGYRKLIIWTKFKELLLITYDLTENLPRSEDFNLKSQMRRAVVSVLSNFAEGYMKGSRKEKLHFLEISKTSLQELEAQAEICLVLNYWSKEDSPLFEQKNAESAYFLYRYTQSVKGD